MPEMLEFQATADDSAVPCYTIDLSDRPQDRYVALSLAYKDKIQSLTQLFDDLLADLGIPERLHGTVNRLASLALRRLHSSSETAEIRGIAKAAQVSLYLLVAFNVVLDLLMGCTSGAVRSLEAGQPLHQAKMLHLRTLDWGMDPLRSVVVQLDFVKSKAASGRQVIASSITYVGYVGVLTGVRDSLSMSLNFRGMHNAGRRRDHFKFYLHHLLVLLGLRQSISSLLRSYLFDDCKAEGFNEPMSLAAITEEVPSKRSTAAYLILSDGVSAVTIEKDYKTAVVRQSRSFIVLTNHDLESEVTGDAVAPTPETLKLASMQAFLDESVDRRDCLVEKWRSKARKEKRRRKREAEISHASFNQHGMSTRASKRATKTVSSVNNVETLAVEDAVSITRQEAISWVSAWPTTNECTHYAVVLDPLVGEVAWVRRYPQPVDEPADQDRRQDFGGAGVA